MLLFILGLIVGLLIGAFLGFAYLAYNVTSNLFGR